jgi:hypothetical protein
VRLRRPGSHVLTLRFPTEVVSKGRPELSFQQARKRLSTNPASGHDDGPHQTLALDLSVVVGSDQGLKPLEVHERDALALSQVTPDAEECRIRGKARRAEKSDDQPDIDCGAAPNFAHFAAGFKQS